jgi:hypothetical protein
MTAPQVRADTRAYTVNITLPEGALEDFVIRLAHDIEVATVDVLDLLEEIRIADSMANSDAATLAEFDTTRDAECNRRDEALTELFKQLPPPVWPLSADGGSADLGRAVLYETERARGYERCACPDCGRWVRRVVAISGGKPDVWYCRPVCQARAAEGEAS